MQELFLRNIGTREQQDRQFPFHRMIGNIHYAAEIDLVETSFRSVLEEQRKAAQ